MINATEFARNWVETTLHGDFRFGVLNYDPMRETSTSGPSLSRAARKQRMERAWKDQIRRVALCHRILEHLQSSELQVPEAREIVCREGLADQIRVLGTKDELIAGIADLLERGANAWDNGGRSAWIGQGVFYCNYWNE